MKLKIAPTSVQSSQHVVPQFFASPKPKSPIDSPSSSTKCTIRFAHSATCTSMKIFTSQSLHNPVSRGHTLKRACSTNFDEFFDDGLSKQIEELAQMFDLSDEKEKEEHWKGSTICTTSKTIFSKYWDSFLQSKLEFSEPPMLGILPETPDCCSVKKAFSSMVFIIVELQCYALQMREVLSCEDLEGIIVRVQREMHASFAWLFEQVFSRTPSLMINVMTLLANFSVHSMANNISVQDPSLFGVLCETTEEVSITEKQDQQQSQFEMVPGNNGGGGNKYLGGSSLLIQYPNWVLDYISWFSSNEDHELNEKESCLWKLVVDEATRMLAEVRDDVLDHETMQQLVSPVTVALEPDNYMDYFRTDLVYQMGLSQEPNNPLLLCNYAQFLFLVAHDHDRAEECFKRAIQVEPLDAEALSQYANFLWIVREDLWGAEERYQQAMAAEPENPYHASKYANFLWNTGGEETCFPLSTSYKNSEAQNL